MSDLVKKENTHVSPRVAGRPQPPRWVSIVAKRMANARGLMGAYGRPVRF